MSAPHFAQEGGRLDLTAGANGSSDQGNRWRLPLEPMRREHESTPAPAAVTTAPPPPPLPPQERPVTVSVTETGVPLDPADFEAPDVTARFAVVQLAEINERITALTELTADKTNETLDKVHNELRRITSIREVDLTEQAAGIFGAVQAGAEALDSFAATVSEVTNDLRKILTDSLESIGGTEGLAAWVAESATELADIRGELNHALARIERDIAGLRQQSHQAAPMSAGLPDDQLTFIVEAVTEAVVSALSLPDRTRRR